ncbi:MAG: hypothetical protein H6760_05080 [Candidatus Nomurabacteria bacterium]|nr:MAG: hypothetical protein H6760_05080 [Candidatus Nomurabacteria bacterium]
MGTGECTGGERIRTGESWEEHQEGYRYLEMQARLDAMSDALGLPLAGSSRRMEVVPPAQVPRWLRPDASMQRPKYAPWYRQSHEW